MWLASFNVSRHTFLAAAFVMLASAAGALPASAQSPQSGRFWIDFGAGWTTAIKHWDTSSRSEQLFGETATRRVIYPPAGSAGGSQVELGYRWRPRLAASIRFGTPISSDFRAALGVQVPSPVFFNTFATDNDLTAVLSRRVRSVDLAVSYEAWTRGRWGVRLFGGPSIVAVSQALVRSISYGQTFAASAPINVVEIVDYETQVQSTTAIGVHAGIDACWMWTKRLGFTALVHGSLAKPRLDDPLSGSPLTMTVGGVYLSAGLRLRF